MEELHALHPQFWRGTKIECQWQQSRSFQKWVLILVIIIFETKHCLNDFYELFKGIRNWLFKNAKGWALGLVIYQPLFLDIGIQERSLKFLHGLDLDYTKMKHNMLNCEACYFINSCDLFLWIKLYYSYMNNNFFHLFLIKVT